MPVATSEKHMCYKLLNRDIIIIIVGAKPCLDKFIRIHTQRVEYEQGHTTGTRTCRRAGAV